MNQPKLPGTDLGLEGKQVVVLGVADDNSIAWGIAEAFLNAGSRVRIGYQQKFFSRVRQLFPKHPGLDGQRCDVLNEAELRDFFESMGERPIDVLVHSIAFGAPEVFTKLPSAVNPEALSQALAVSAYSLPLVVGAAKSRLAEWSSVISLSFVAAQRAVPIYGLMGVAKATLESATRYLALELGTLKARINTISAGPVETLAALGILLAFSAEPEVIAQLPGDIMKDSFATLERENPGLHDSDQTMWAKLAWRQVQEGFARRSPLPEFICKEDVANCALFLGSDLSRKITGQVFHVDSGLSSSLIL